MIDLVAASTRAASQTKGLGDMTQSDFGPMVPVQGLGRDDVAKIVAYVRTVQESEGIFRDPTHR